MKTATFAVAPQKLLLLILALGLLCAAVAAQLATGIAVPSARLVVIDQRIVVDEQRFGGVAQVPIGTVVRSFVLADGTRLDAHPTLLLEEPDVLPSYDAINDFMVAQSRLAQSLAANDLMLIDEQDHQWRLQARQRGLVELPAVFWLQVLFGLGGLLLGSSIWAFRPDDVAARLYALTGACYALAAMSAAVYSSRELAMAGASFRALSAINHAGTIFFAAALLGLIWHYPRPLRPWPVARLALLVAVLFLVIDLAQLSSGTPPVMQVGIFVLFLPCFPLALLQWRSARHRPVDRAALTWFFLSLFSGTTLFAALVLLPPLFGLPPYAPQSLMLGVFLLVYAGIALALTRYRLFDIERWWFNIWIWFLGGVVVIVLDAILLLTLPLTGLAATGIAVALVGWLYFPLRQWLWRRVMPNANDRLSDLLPRLVSDAASARDLDSLRDIYRRMLSSVFQPLRIDEITAPTPHPRIEDDGQRLTLPGLMGDGGISLCFPGRGGRLFSRTDLGLASALISLVRHAATAIERREQGIADERQRIMRDLHDDLGSKLLAMAHTGNDDTQRMARSALQDVRDILQALEAGPSRLSALLELCRWELQSRSEAHGFQPIFDAPELVDDLELSAREATNIIRIVREGITNAVRHAGASRISIRLWVSGSTLGMELRNDGAAERMDPAKWASGRGRRTIRARAGDLGGHADWRVDAKTGETLLSLSLCIGHGRDPELDPAV